MKPFNNMGMSPMEKELRQHQMFFSEMRELDDYKNCINRVVREYTEMIDTKIANQNLKVHNAESFMRDTILETATDIVTQLFADGKIVLDLTYDPNTESLYIGGELIE